MYSLAGYGEMIADRVRRQAYVDAMERVIRPGCVVLEIGTGPGVFAIYAARLGARKIYAVESNDVIQIGRQLAAANGLDDRVEFLQGLSTDLDLPEKADVILSDLRGLLPLFGNHLDSIIDARQRLLEPGGILIPQQDSLWASVVTAEDLYLALGRGWREHEFDLDLSLPLGLVTNTIRKASFEADQCLVEPRQWAVLDYRSVNASSNFSGRANWVIGRAGCAHGLAVWFDTILTADIGFSNAPGRQELIYGRAFFPFPKPIELLPGDCIAVDLAAVLVGEDYVWRWETVVEAVSGVCTRFEQSSFEGLTLSPTTLRKRAADYMPELSEDGEMVRFVLDRMDGKTSLETIARALQAACPTRFAHWRDALTRVGELAVRHS